MMMKTIILLIISVFCLSCKPNTKTTFNQKEINTINKDTEKKSVLNSSTGVIIFNSSVNENLKHFEILNDDDSVYLSVSFNNAKMKFNQSSMYDLYSYGMEEDQISKMYNFSPYMFYPETGEVIIFICKKITDDYFYIYTDSDFETLRKIKRSNLFNFENWNTHILNSFVRPKDNLLYEKPDLIKGKSINISESIESFEVISFEDGDWLKIRCFEDCNGCKNFESTNYYIKWRNGDDILIDFNYLC